MPHATLDGSHARDAHIAQRLRDDLIVWLATVRPDGRPHLAAVWFLWDGETVLIFSKPNQKMRNLRTHPQVTLALDDTQGGDDPLVIEGTATLLPQGAITPELEAYAKKYAGQFAAMKWTPAQMAQSYTESFRITPTRFISL